ncbi:MAG: FAD-dependent oxidoreductase [Anaerolineae bacterium]
MPGRVLVVGGSVGGVRAALSLAGAGVRVDLVESSPFLGEGAGFAGEFSAFLLEPFADPNVRVHLSCVPTGWKREGDGWTVRLRAEPRYVDLARCTACGDCLEVCPVVLEPGGRRAIYVEATGAVPNVPAIRKEGRSPCADACPAGISVQGYVALIAQGRFQEALDLIREKTPFPGVLGRVCHHPCEEACRRCELDEAVSLRSLKRFVADWELAQAAGAQPPEEPMGQPDGPRVAVVGSGPAGLTAAAHLAGRGYRVTVFEALPVAGGMMAVGIPAYRLPREVLRYEIARVQRLGVEIRLNTPVGPGGLCSLEDLRREGYGAVLLCVGAGHPLRLGVAGEDLPGVVQGLDLLRALALSQEFPGSEWADRLRALVPAGPGRRAIVIGGGNTAMDAARSLKRLGLDDVQVFYRRSQAEMPAAAEEVRGAEEEGISFRFLVTPVRCLGDGGQLSALECVRMELGEPDESGRRRPVPVPESEFTEPADLVVVAVGQRPNLGLLEGVRRIGVDRQGRLEVCPDLLQTGLPWVFAAGDAVDQPMTVVNAVGSGRRAAEAVDAFLRGELASFRRDRQRELPVVDRPLRPEERVALPGHPLPMTPAAERVADFREVEQGWPEATAQAEAARCLACGPCSECLACVHVCQARAIDHRSLAEEIELRVATVIWASASAPGLTEVPRAALSGVVRPEDDEEALAAAARALVALGWRPEPWPAFRVVHPAVEGRVGVFLCECGGEIASVLDLEWLGGQLASRSEVAFVEQVKQSCTPEGLEQIRTACRGRGIAGAVLAACSCCALEQVCDACTLQRVRCKAGLDLLGQDGIGRQPEPLPVGFQWEAVNLREGCAWPHAGDGPAGTQKALRLILAGLAALRSRQPLTLAVPGSAEDVVVAGRGPAGDLAARMLRRLGFHVRRTGRAFLAAEGVWGGLRVLVGNGGRAAMLEGRWLILSPANRQEHLAMGRALHGLDAWQMGDRQPGVVVCDPRLDPQVSAPAAVARVAASWKASLAPAGRLAFAQPAFCRACGTCRQVCPYQAIGWGQTVEGRTFARVDPLRCRGCGVCISACPNGAMTVGQGSDQEVWAALLALLA